MKVLYKGKPYKVYGVSPSPYTQGYYYEKGADFLIYIKNSWVWVSSDYCIPYKKKKNINRKETKDIRYRYVLRDVSLFALTNCVDDEEKIIFTIQGSKADMDYNLTFPVVVLKDENDSVPYMAYIPYFDVMTQGYDEEELQMMVKDLLNLCLEDKESYTIPAWAYSYFNEDDVKERGRKYFEELDDGDDTYFQKNFYTVWWFDFRR